jgi:hypothetical protein
MNKKAILGISLTAAFAVSMIFAQNAIADEDGIPDFRQIVSTEVTYATDSNNEGIMKATITTEGPIPANGKGGAFGYGLITDDTSAVLALTTHLCVSDTLVQGDARDKICDDDEVVGLLDALTEIDGLDVVHDDATFHAHMLVLKGTELEECAGSPDPTFAQVDVPATLAYNAANESEEGALDILSPSWPVKVHGNHITVGNVPLDALPDSGVEGIVSYGIHPEATDGVVTNLCLTNPEE